VELILAVVGAVTLLVVIVSIAVSRGGDAPIGGSDDMSRADAEARARSAGIDHLPPGS